MVWLWQPDPVDAGRGFSPSPGLRPRSVSPGPQAVPPAPAAPPGWPMLETGVPRPMEQPAWPVPLGPGAGFAPPGMLPAPAPASPPRPPMLNFDYSLGKGVGQAVPQGNAMQILPVPSQPGVGVPMNYSSQMNGPMQFISSATTVPSTVQDRQLINVPVQPLPHSGAALRSATPPPLPLVRDVTPNGLITKIGGMHPDAEPELAHDAAEGPPSPAMDWLDRKIEALQDRQQKRAEQQAHLAELRRMVSGNSYANTTDMSDGRIQTSVPDRLTSLPDRYNDILSVPAFVESAVVDPSLMQADQAVLRHQALQLQRQRMESDREREELLHVRATLEKDAESRLKDIQSLTEAIETGERRAQVAEESASDRVREAEVVSQGLRERLEAAEAALEKERQISKQALDVQAASQADINGMQEVSLKVLGDCKALQARIKDLEEERAASHDARASFEETSRGHLGRIEVLEQTIRQLEEENLKLRRHLEVALKAAQETVVAASPRREEPLDEISLQEQRVLQLREELAAAEAEAAQAAEAPSVLSRPSAPDGLALLGSLSGRRDSSRPGHSRIKELEREMAAAHHDTLSLDGMQRGPRPATRSSVPHTSQASSFARARSETDPSRHSLPHGFSPGYAPQGSERQRGSATMSRSTAQNHRRSDLPSNGYKPVPSGLEDHFMLVDGLTNKMRKLSADWNRDTGNGCPSLVPVDDDDEETYSGFSGR